MLPINLAILSAAAVEYRYPGDSATREIAKICIDTCKALRNESRLKLGLQ